MIQLIRGAYHHPTEAKDFNGSAGRDLQTALKANKIPDAKILTLDHPQGTDSELEDLLSDEFYYNAVCRTYPDKTVDKPDHVSGKRTKRYEAAYNEKYAIGFSKRRVSETIKKMLLDGSGDKQSLDNLEKLVSKLYAALLEQTSSALVPGKELGDSETPGTHRPKD